MPHLHINAADVLPPELLSQVQKHWKGYLWIPETGKNHKFEALALIQSGMKAENVADALGISLGRVYQIARSLAGDNPFRRKSHVPLAHNPRLAPV